MSEDKFNMLIKNSTGLGKFSKDIFLIGLGLAIKIVAVWGIYIYNGYKGHTSVNILTKVEPWEYISVIVCIILAGLLWIISVAIVSDRDTLIKEIRQFYKEDIK